MLDQYVIILNRTLCRFTCINYEKKVFDFFFFWFVFFFVFQVPQSLDCFPVDREDHWSVFSSSDVFMILNDLDLHHCETVVQTRLRYLGATETVIYSLSDGDQTLCESECSLSSIVLFCWMYTFLCHFMKIFSLLLLDICYCCLSMLIIEKMIAIFDYIMLRLCCHRTSLL